MKFAVVAHRHSATNEALVAAAHAWGLDSELLEPHTALTSLEPGDIALARLDVREGLDVLELNGAVDFRPVYAPDRDVFADAVAALLEDGRHMLRQFDPRSLGHVHRMPGGCAASCRPSF